MILPTTDSLPSLFAIPGEVFTAAVIQGISNTNLQSSSQMTVNSIPINASDYTVAIGQQTVNDFSGVFGGTSNLNSYFGILNTTTNTYQDATSDPGDHGFG